MLTILLIALFFGLVSILFLIAEINQSFRNVEEIISAKRGVYKLTLIWLVPIALLPVLLDVAITLFVIWLFGMSGVLGMLLTLMASALVSVYLFFRRKRRIKTIT